MRFLGYGLCYQNVGAVGVQPRTMTSATEDHSLGDVRMSAGAELRLKAGQHLGIADDTEKDLVVALNVVELRVAIFLLKIVMLCILTALAW